MVDVCNHLKLNYIDLEGTIFRQGYMPAHIKGNLSHLFSERGYAYLGFRSFWIRDQYDISDNKCLLLIRDPRDAMVSHYFSYLYSHGIPSSGPVSTTMSNNRSKFDGIDINEYVLRPQFINVFKNGFQNYETFLAPHMTRVYRYEDIIYFKSEWLADMLNHLGVDLPGDIASDIVKKHDVRPLQEDPSKHVRQVAPGNFRQHLAEETIRSLNEALSHILNKYGYDRVNTVSL